MSKNCILWDPVKYDIDCPSSDWQAIQKILDLTAYSIPKSEQSYGGPLTPSEVEVTGRSSLRQLLSASEYINNGTNFVFAAGTASSQHVAVADALTTTGMLWSTAMSNTSTNGHGSVLDQLDAVHSITAGYYQPYTSVVCEYDVIHGPSDVDPVVFPAYPGYNIQLEQAVTVNHTIHPEHNLVYPNITRSDIINTPGPPGEHRLRWVELPFNETAIGAVVLTPRSPENTTQELLMCSIGAGWGLSTMNTSTIGGTATPISSRVDTKALSDALHHAGSTNYHGKYIPGITQAAEANLLSSGFFFLPFFPQRPVIVTEDWANYLNPSIEYLNTTVFNTLMQLNATQDSISHRQTLAELILTEMVANGLSRIGSTSQVQGIVRQSTEPGQAGGLDGNYWFSGKGNNVFQVDPAESKDWVKFRVASTIEGYSYNKRGTTTKLAIGLLLVYCLVAIIHIIYAGISGISSTCWDSIGEVTALAMNSTPTAALRNTCAGITELNIFKLPVRVLAFRDAEGDGEHLELVFGKLDEKTLENKTIKANRVYGTMPTVEAHDKIA